MCGIMSGGFANLGVDYTTRDGKQINGSAVSYLGSGVTGINGLNMPIDAAVGYFRHEYCHYTLGYHKAYSTIGGGDGTETALGYELGFSPMDMIAVGYANVTNFNPSISTYTIGDLHSTGDIIKIPTSNTNESFLISNRQRIIGDNYGKIYDCNMAGDTAMGLPFLQFHDYSKGLYIYHAHLDNAHEFGQDLECADGLWNWGLNGSSTPDWNNQQILPVFMKTGIGLLDDNPSSPVNSNTRLYSRDGHSVVDYTNSINYNPPQYHNKWFTLGKRHTQLNEQGVDRVFTNLQENWCSRETMGDRWDAWKRNYNEVFSPFSSPNTKDKFNNNTGIFVYYSLLNGNTATIKIYQGNPGTFEEFNALLNTPPSKPILYRPVEVFNCNGTYGFPRITWDNNLEPDMERTSGMNSFKRYNVYRANASGSSVPLSYTYIGIYDDYTPNDTANYIDNNVINGVMIFCNLQGQGYNDTWYRYKISAVDLYNDESVKSDFVSIKGHSFIPDNIPSENEVPHKFSLEQNYPNPFNPTTAIKFDLPQNTFVTLKVYNAIGQVVAELVSNEYKNAGRYNINFDGSNFASGIYFYSLEAGTFKDIKKMILVK